MRADILLSVPSKCIVIYKLLNVSLTVRHELTIY